MGLKAKSLAEWHAGEQAACGNDQHVTENLSG